MCFFQRSFRTERRRSVYCIFLLGQIHYQWFDQKEASFASAMYNEGKLSCKLKMKVKAQPLWNKWEFCHSFERGQHFNQDINFISFCLVLGVTQEQCYVWNWFFSFFFFFSFLSKRRKKIWKKIISSQPRPIVCFATPKKPPSEYIFCQQRYFLWHKVYCLWVSNLWGFCLHVLMKTVFQAKTIK